MTMADPHAKHTNRLAAETSPYLLQHAHNPVDWYPWGEEAFAAARQAGKPLLVSIGYSACHWCHVMERECFENEELAALINRTVIPVKVDREERPDVDAIYMEACVALTGQGGWPLNAFVTPALKPFYVGTYFPPESRWGRPGFRDILQRIGEAWQANREAIEQQADELNEEFRRLGERSAHRGAISPDVFGRLVDEAARQFDGKWGGFGGAPKFPPDQRLAALLVAHQDLGDRRALDMVRSTLGAMARGGIYDHLAGGFARYAVDGQWAVPHFEKMLYTQGLLVPVYLDAALVTGDEEYRAVARETLDWVLDAMRTPEGLFCCALDADSEGEEGRYYTWTPAQILGALGESDGRLACEYFGVTDEGNMEGRLSTLHAPPWPVDFAGARGIPLPEWNDWLASARRRLLEVRGQRVPPAKDDKCLTGWNGLMIGALARGWQVLHDRRYLAAARAAADALLSLQMRDGCILRCRTRGESRIGGLLEDYAYLLDGLLDLQESDCGVDYFAAACGLGRVILEKFGALGGGFFTTDGTDASLLRRGQEPRDGALPSAAAVAARALFRLALHGGDDTFRMAATAAVEAAARPAGAVPGAFAATLLAWRYGAGPTPTVTVYHGDGLSGELAGAAWETYLPARAITHVRGVPGTAAAVAQTPAAVVCLEGTCMSPVHSADALASALHAIRTRVRIKVRDGGH